MNTPPQRHPGRDQRAVRDAEIYRLKVAGLTERAIADRFSLAPATVHAIIDRGRRDLLTPGAEAMRQMEADRLDDARRRASAVASRVHVVVQGGKVVKDDDGAPVRDDGPVLKANEQLVRISESWRRLFGLDAPEQLSVSLDRRIEAEATDVAEVLLKVLPEVLSMSGIKLGHQGHLTRWGIDLAAWYLMASGGENPGPRPLPPRLAVAELEPAEADRPEPAPPPFRRERDASDDVIARAQALLDEEADDDEV
ncbi:hypothetical protein ACWC1C_05340 [Streptomyces sp. NPDC001705]